MIPKTISTLLLAIASTLILASPVHADQILVPQDWADLQVAIDKAAPGDVIVITGGIHAPVVVKKSLTLVGSHASRPFVRVANPGEELSFPDQGPAILLAGSGSGVVTLANLDLGGTTDGSYFGVAGEAIAGGGFDELRVMHCTLTAPTWFFPTGVGFAPDAVELEADVEHLLLSDSVVVGGEGTYDFPPTQPFDIPVGGAGVDAPATTVTVVDSTVRGGGGLDMVFNIVFYCPSDCDDVDFGEGGPAVTALAVHHAGSLLAGGEGATVHCASPTGAMTLICTRASGPAVSGASSVVALPGTLFGSGDLVTGSYWTLTWSSPSPTVFLVFSPTPMAPLDLGPKGLLFMDPDVMLIEALPGGALQSASFFIPADATFYGVPLAIQVYDPATGLTRPVFGAFTPQ
jgi:hypothetical protein